MLWGSVGPPQNRYFMKLDGTVDIITSTATYCMAIALFLQFQFLWAYSFFWFLRPRLCLCSGLWGEGVLGLGPTEVIFSHVLEDYPANLS